MWQEIRKERQYLFSIGLTCFVIFYISCSAENVGDTKDSENRNKPQSVETLATKIDNFKSDSTDKNVEVFWQGESGNSHLTITARDVIVTRAGKEERLLSDYVTRVEGKEPTALSNSCKDRWLFRPISLVDKLLTVSQESMTVCDDSGGNPGREVLWFTVNLESAANIPYTFQSGLDISGSGRLAKLTDYFSNEEVRTSLLNAPEIRSALENHTRNDFHTVSDLFEALKDDNFGKTSSAKLTSESLYAFSFNRIEADNVVVRLSLIPMGRRFHIEYLEIKLPIKGKLEQSLKLAGLQEKGFLEIKAEQIFAKDIEVAADENK